MRICTLLTFLFLLQTCVAAQEPEIVIQSGVTGLVIDCAISPNGKYLATGSADNNVKLWDIRTKKEVRVFGGRNRRITKVIFSPDSEKIAAGDDIGNIFVWAVQTGELQDNFEGKTYSISLAFSDDGSRLATYGKYKTFVVRDLFKRKTLAFPDIESQGIKLAFLKGDRDRIASIKEDNTFSIWNLQADSVEGYVRFADTVSDFILSKDGRFLISIIKAPSSIQVFDLKAWRVVRQLSGLYHIPDHVVMGDDDSTIFTKSEFVDDNIDLVKFKQWNFLTGEAKDSLTIIRENDETKPLHFSPVSKELIFQFGSAKIGVVDTEPLRMKRLLKNNGTLIIEAFERDSGQFIVVTEDGRLKKLNIRTNQYTIIPETADLPLIAQFIKLKDSSKALMLLNSDSAIYEIDMRTFQKSRIVSDRWIIRDLKVSEDGKRVMYFRNKMSEGYFRGYSALFVKDLHNDSLLFRQDFNTNYIPRYGFMNNGSLLALQGEAGEITLFDIDKGRSRSLFMELCTGLCDVTSFMMLDSVRMLSTTKGGNFYIWNIDLGTVLHYDTSHNKSFVYKTVLSSDSSTFLSFSDDVVRIWDSKNLELKRTFHGHSSWVLNGGYLRGEKEIYTCGTDNTFRIWDVASSKEKVSFITVDSADMVARLPNKYYAATKTSIKRLTYRIGNELFPFAQFDLQYNRPHEVLKVLGAKDTLLLSKYSRAFTKRLERSGFIESDFNNDMHVPEAVFLNNQQHVVTERDYVLRIKFSDSRYKLDRYFISINNVPLNGINGTRIKKSALRSFRETFAVPLSVGENTIQISCLNIKGVESRRKEMYINYKPAKNIEPIVHFIGLGVSKYRDSARNLVFADKDIRDLATFFKRKGYSNLLVDTLLNERVTVESVQDLKKKLSRTSVDDIVIVSYSGHGIFDKDLNYFLATHDVDFNDPVRGLPYEVLEGLLEDIPARKKLLLVDACYSGEIDKDEMTLDRKEQPKTADLVRGGAEGRGVILLPKANANRPKSIIEIMNELFADITRGSGAVVISASGAREYALEDVRFGNGIFTYCIMQGLSDLKADRDGNGLSVSELQNFVSKQVVEITKGKQRPTSRKENIEFDWIIW